MNTHLVRLFNLAGSARLLLVGFLLLAMTMAIGWFIPAFEEISYLLVPGALFVVAIALMATRFERLPFYLLVVSFPLLVALPKNSNISNLLVLVPGGLAILAWLQQFALHRTTIVFDRSTTLAVLVGIWVIISAMYAGTIMTLPYDTFRYWLVIFLLVLTQNLLRKKRHLIEIGWVMSISLGLLGAFVLINQTQIYLQSGGSIIARLLHASIRSFSDPNITGMQINTGIPFALNLMSLAEVKESRRRSYLLALCATLMILGVLSTFSIGAAIGLCVTLALSVIWVKSRSQQAGLTLLSFIVIGAALLSPLSERLNEQLLVVEQGSPMEWGRHRGLGWYIGVQAIRQAPWLGHGPGTTGVTEVSLQYMPFNLVQSKLIDSRNLVVPHNIFLNLGAEIGLLGLLAFIACLFSVMLPLWREVRHQGTRSGDAIAYYMGRAVLISLIALLVQAMGLPGQLQVYLWLLLGVGLAFTRISIQTRLE